MPVVASGWTSTRYAGDASNRNHTLGAIPSAGDAILVFVGRENGSVTGAQNHATSLGFVEMDHLDPANTSHIIATALKKRADGGETTINVDWVENDDDPNQVIASVIVSGLVFDSIVCTLVEDNEDHFDYPPDSLDFNLHVAATQEDDDISADVFPSGDTNQTYSAIDFVSGGIAQSGGGTVSGTFAENIRGAWGTISGTESVGATAASAVVSLENTGESEMTEGQYTIEVRPRPGAPYGTNCTLGDHGDMTWRFLRGVNTPGAEATIIVENVEGCCDCIPKKWRDEIFFWRHHPLKDRNSHLAYYGTVTSVTEEPSSRAITIVAQTNDVRAFGGKIVATDDHIYTDAGLDEFDVATPDTRIDAMTLFLELWNDAEAQQPSGLTIQPEDPGLTGVLMSCNAPAGTSLGPELQRVMDAAVDVSVVGNVMYVGALDISATPFSTLNPDADWDQSRLAVVDDGELTVTAVTVNGKDGSTATYPTDSAEWNHPEVGILHEVLNVNSIEGDDECAAYAKSYYELHSPEQDVYVSTERENGTVSCDWPVPMSLMVPGRIFAFDTSDAENTFCSNRNVATRLAGMTVVGANSIEQEVKVVLVPEGMSSEGITT